MKCEKSVSPVITYTFYYNVLWHDKTGKRLLAFSRKIKILPPILASVGRLTPVSLAVRQAKEKCFFR